MAESFPEHISYCVSKYGYSEVSEHSFHTGHVTHANTQETEVGGLPQGPGWPGLHSEV